jgi:predicted metal-binding protein
MRALSRQPAALGLRLHGPGNHAGPAQQLSCNGAAQQRQAGSRSAVRVLPAPHCGYCPGRARRRKHIFDAAESKL